MKKYEFDLVLKGLAEINEDQADALFAKRFHPLLWQAGLAEVGPS